MRAARQGAYEDGGPPPAASLRQGATGRRIIASIGDAVCVRAHSAQGGRPITGSNRDEPPSPPVGGFRATNGTHFAQRGGCGERRRRMMGGPLFGWGEQRAAGRWARGYPPDGSASRRSSADASRFCDKGQMRTPDGP